MEAVFDRVFHLGKADLDAHPLQVVVESREGLGGGEVNVGDRLGGDDDPFRGRRRLGDRVQNVLVKRITSSYLRDEYLSLRGQ